MTYEEKLDLILKAIIEAQKATINGQSTKLYIKADNGLETIGKDEVRDILLKLQLEDNVLKINDMYNRLLSIGELLLITMRKNEKNIVVNKNLLTIKLQNFTLLMKNTI